MSASGHARILNGTLERHGVDLEALARKALHDARLHQYEADREDLLAYLIAEAWKASEEYDPRRRIAFSTFCYQRLRLRTIDWIRQTEGRTRWTFSPGVHTPLERTVPDILSLEGHDLTDTPDRATNNGRLGDALTGSAPDPADHRSPELTRALLHRDRIPARDQPAGRQRRPRRARRRDPGTSDGKDTEAA